MKYSPPFFLFNAHLETIYPALFRKVAAPAYRRERIQTPDEDFLDLDWMNQPQSSDKLVILSHGLEGNASRAYIKGMARAFFGAGMDVLAWNYRGCSEEMNKKIRFYHSGATDDLGTVIQHAINTYPYRDVYLIGFSLGGNITLKFLGEGNVPPVIKKAAVFSVPMDLKTSCEKISEPSNRVYANRFLKSLKLKVKKKAAAFPEIDTKGIDNIQTLLAFDNQYTAPLHGFKDGLHYYETCSSIRFVKNIQIPTLIVNALNDPFLSKECFPQAMLKDHPYVTFEIPPKGGHVGFSQFNKNGLYWSEARALQFITS